jgi:hypothetical protein
MRNSDHQTTEAVLIKAKRKGIPERDKKGLQGCEESKIPHFPDKCLKDGGEIFSLTGWPRFTARDSCYLFLFEA